MSSVTSIVSSMSGVATAAKAPKAKAVPKKEKSMSEIISTEVETFVELVGLAARADLESKYESVNNLALFDSYPYLTTTSPEAKKADPRKPWVSVTPAARLMLAQLFVRMHDEIKDLDAVSLARVANVNLSPEEQQNIATASKGDPIAQSAMIANALNVVRAQALAREVGKTNGPDSLISWASKLISETKFAPNVASVVDAKKYFHGKFSHLLKCEPTSVVPTLASFIYESLLKIIGVEIAIGLWVDHETVKPAHIHRFMISRNVPDLICDDVLSAVPEAKPRTPKKKAVVVAAAAAVAEAAPAVTAVAAALNQV